MTVEEALVIVDAHLQQKSLKNVQELVFRCCWEGQTYSEIAENSSYDIAYIRNVGSRLWQLLSQAFGEKVTKSNFQSVLRRKAQTISLEELQPPQIATAPGHTANINISIQLDWLEVTSHKYDLREAITNKQQNGKEAVDISFFQDVQQN